MVNCTKYEIFTHKCNDRSRYSHVQKRNQFNRRKMQGEWKIAERYINMNKWKKKSYICQFSFQQNHNHHPWSSFKYQIRLFYENVKMTSQRWYCLFIRISFSVSHCFLTALAHRRLADLGLNLFFSRSVIRSLCIFLEFCYILSLILIVSMNKMLDSILNQTEKLKRASTN